MRFNTFILKTENKDNLINTKGRLIKDFTILKKGALIYYVSRMDSNRRIHGYFEKVTSHIDGEQMVWAYWEPNNQLGWMPHYEIYLG